MATNHERLASHTHYHTILYNMNVMETDDASTISDAASFCSDVSSLTVIRFAEKLQQHKRYIRTEFELKEECDRTKGRVEYKPPGVYEMSRHLSEKRRREVRRWLEKYAEEQRLEHLAKERQSKRQFISTEERIKKECLATSGDKKVVYEPPTSTELEQGTKMRRQRLRRKMRAYYRHRAKCYAIAFAYAESQLIAYAELQSLSPAHYRWHVLRKLKVRCALGNDVCPCRGYDWGHPLFNWDRRSDESFKEEKKKYWSRCHSCRTGYDTRFSGEDIDYMVSYCEKFVRQLHAAAEADKNTFTTGEQLVISIFDVGERLLPRVRAFYGDDMNADEYVSKMKECIGEFVKDEHAEFLKDREHEHKATELHLGLVGAAALDNIRNRPPSPLVDCDLIQLLCPSLYEEELSLEGVEIKK